MEKILIIQTASLGDVVLATPIIECLSEEYPNAKIDFLLKYGYQDIFKQHPKLHNIFIWDKREKKYARLWELINIVRENNYDAVINVQRFASTGLVTALSRSGIRIGFDKNPLSLFFTQRVKHWIGTEKNLPHETERNLELIKSISNCHEAKMKLYPQDHDYAKVSQYKTSEYITIAPASLWFTKQFPVEKWIEFISTLDQNIRIYFLGSSKEKQICEEIINRSGHKNSLSLAGTLSFLESAALMKDAQMNYMNDSAPMHFASAVNAKTCVIYCSTVPEFGFGPRADNAVIVQTHKELSCKPCGLHGHMACPQKHFDCAFTIDVKQLTDSLES
ncbi:MAG: glycosyltransferase family 9 protein [Bacteroidales bacterium]|nr:glycosyltransferase family 9 protein [Bacteroidales bacterium]